MEPFPPITHRHQFAFGSPSRQLGAENYRAYCCSVDTFACSHRPHVAASHIPSSHQLIAVAGRQKRHESHSVSTAQMYCYQSVPFLLLLLSCCQALRPATEPELALVPRSSRSGSKSPSPSRSRERTPPRSTRLFGVDLSQPPSRPESIANPRPSTHVRPPQSSHAPPAQSSQTHPAPSAHSVYTRPQHPIQIGQSRPLHLVLPGRPCSPMYAEWVTSLEGPLERKPVGRPNNPPPGAGKDWKSPRFEKDKRYREKQKLKKQIQQQGDEHSSGHQQHPPKDGGPGSPGAGSHAVGKT